MKLSDVISQMDLTLWPKMALVIFLAVFVSVCVRVLRRSKVEMNGCAMRAIEDGVEVSSKEKRP